MPTVKIPFVPMTHNQQLRCHWAKRMRENADWKTLISVFLKSPPEPVTTKQRVDIHMHRVKLQDPDNLVGSVKPILDALVAQGWLRDDTFDLVDLHVSETRCGAKSERMTEVQVEPVVDGVDCNVQKNCAVNCASKEAEVSHDPSN